MVGISFGTLSLMQSWLERYEKYMDNFNVWMDIYPESEAWQDRLKIQKAHDDVMDKMGLNIKN